MRMSLTRENLLDYLRDRVGIDPSSIDDDTPLYSSGLADSFSMVDLVMFLEGAVGSTLDPVDITLDNLDSVSRILKFAETRMQAG